MKNKILTIKNKILITGILLFGLIFGTMTHAEAQNFSQGTRSILTGYDDWSHLEMNFQEEDEYDDAQNLVE